MSFWWLFTIVMVVVGLIAIVGAVTIAVWATRRAARRRMLHMDALRSEAAPWPAVAGRVLHSDVVAEEVIHDELDNDGMTKHVRHTEYLPAVVYEFDVAGRAMRGGVIDICDLVVPPRHRDIARARAIAARYPPGSTVTVYVAPDDPTRCCLVR